MGDWFWGNNRGGGGAPLRDSNGNVITNLKAVVQQIDSPHKKFDGSPPQRRRNDNDNDYDDNRNSFRRGGGGGARRGNDDYYENDRGDDRRGARGADRDSDRRRDYPSQQQQHSPQRSPKKFMGSLQEMNNGLPMDERQEKQKRAMEYQDMLRQQIEENNRKKAIEKRQLDDEKRREYDEYMSTVHGKSSVSNAGRGRDFDDRDDSNRKGNDNGNRDADRRRPNDYDDDMDSRRRDGQGRNGPNSKSNGSGGRRRHDDDDSDDSVNQYNNKNKTKAPASIPGLSMKNAGRNRRSDEDDEDIANDRDNGHNSNAKPRRVRMEEDFDDDNDAEDGFVRAPPRKSQPQQQRRHSSDAVSMKEYDELSALCDKLLVQQEQLQNEIRTQSNLIKDLQKGGGRPAVGPALRSKSAVQSRREESNSSKKTDQAAAQRPLSMRQPSKAVASGAAIVNSKKVPTASEQMQVKKQSKVAFGGSVAPADKRGPPPPVNAPASKTPSNAKGSNGKVPSLGLNKPPGVGAGGIGKGGNGGGGGGGGGGLGGFAKLQQQVSRQGPMVVSYDDDEGYSAPSAGRRGGGNTHTSNSELRGLSHYIPVDDDLSVQGHNGKGDQLDQLLSRARKGKFS